MSLNSSSTLISQLIEKFQLISHPEGGYYAETYRSNQTIRFNTTNNQELERNASTAIYFLITPGSCSRLHRLTSDEVWHFYLGESMTVVELDPTAPQQCRLFTLGPNVLAGEKVQHTVRAGTWFGSYSNEGSAFSFVGCTVSPGFDFCDFELASRAQLLVDFPSARSVIEKLTEGLP